MKMRLLIFILLLSPFIAFSQGAPLYGTAVGYVNGTPTFTPNTTQKGSELCVSINNKMLYLWNRDSSEWKPLGGITVIFGVPSTAPAAAGGTRTAINMQTGLIYWWNGTVWKEIIAYSVELAGTNLIDSLARSGWVSTADLADGAVTWVKLAQAVKDSINAGGSGGSPSGAAGGDLTGTYPNPTIGNDKIISAYILDGTLVNADLANQTIDSNKVKNRAMPLLKIAPSGATNGQIPKYNSTTGNWEPGTDNNSGGGTSIVYDNFRLPGIYEYFPATGLLANESVTNYGFTSVNSTYYKFSTTALGSASTEYGGWLANGTSGDSIGISAPFGVIIGDSQAEGHGAGVHGRLHPGGASIFTRTVQDVAGNPSFYLRGLTKMRWFNHGIGGQTTANIWARWRRDVLAETFDAADGRGSKTLNRKPSFVIVIAGINDLATLTTQSWTVAAANLELMARSARDNGITAVFLNCPGDEVITELCARRVDSLNTWMASGTLQALGAAVVDYNRWWRDPTYNDNFHGNSLLADDIHPTAVGYDSLMNYTFRAAKLPVLTGIRFRNELSPLGFADYSRPLSINIQGVAHTIADEDDLVAFATPLAWDSVQVKINSSTNVTGTTYSGFSHIEWLFQNDTTGLATKRPQKYQSSQGTVSQTFSKIGNVISPTNTANLLTLGTVTPYSTTSLLTIKGAASGGNNLLNVAGSANANIFNVLDNGRVIVGGGSIGGYAFGVVGSSQFQQSSTNYTNLNGASVTVYGAPNLILQSTAVNTGASGYTRTDLTWNGADGAWTPHPTFGVNGTWSWKNLAGSNIFRIDLANQGTRNSTLALGTTPNLLTGHLMENTTLATSGNQQISPMVRWAGQGWATSPGASRLVDFAAYVTPVQGATPTGYLGIGSGINSSYNYDQFRFHSDGTFSIASTIWADHAKTIGAFTGTGTPEGAVTAAIGSTFRRTDGSAGTTFYVKETGSGNTGWVAYSSTATGAAGGDLTGTYPNPTVGANKIVTSYVLDGTLLNADLASQTVDSNKIKNRAITTIKIEDNAVTASKVASQTLDSADVKNRGVTLLKLAASGATNAQVPKFNSTSGNWEAGAVTQVFTEEYNTVTSTSSPVTLSSTQADNLIDQGGTQATFTLNLPASPLDGQICTITYNNAITTLTIDGNGNTIVGSAVVTGVPGSQRKFKFYTGIGWMKIY